MPTEAAAHDRRLGDFLRARRTQITPGQAGLAPGLGPRRTPGLRREEVAILAGVSENYYTRLEQGKETRPSIEVLDALARVFRLTEHEHTYLHEIAIATAQSRSRISPHALSALPPSVEPLLEKLRPFAAYVLNRRTDILASNPAGAAIFPGMETWQFAEHNVARYLFLHPIAKSIFRDDWDQQARDCVAGLRAAAGLDPAAPGLTELVAELSDKSSTFARLWAQYYVKRHTPARKTVHHPAMGTITLGFQALPLEGAPGQRLSVFYAEPDTPAYEALIQLDRGETPTRS